MNKNTKLNMPQDWRDQVATIAADAQKLVDKAKKLKEEREKLISTLRNIYHAKKTRSQKQGDITYIQYAWTRSDATFRSIEPAWKAIVAREQKLLERLKKLAGTHQLQENERQLLGNMGAYSAEIYGYLAEMKTQKRPQTDKK